MGMSMCNWWLPVGDVRGIVAAVTLRWGPFGEPWDMGMSREGEAAERRLKATLDALGLSGSRYAKTRQVHGSRVVTVSQHLLPIYDEADGLVTCESDLPLVTVHADCYPVFLMASRAVGLLHIGWRGLLAGVVDEGLSAMARCGVSMDELRVFFGPGIGPCCYQFEGEARQTILDVFGVEVFQGDCLDLYRAIVVQLLKGGLRPKAVGPRPLCTSCNGHLFFSHRREGQCGRFAAMVALL